MRKSGYYNGEGYYDPTAGAALENIEREERRNRKARVYHAPAKPNAKPAAQVRGQGGRCTAIHFFDKPGEAPKNKPMEDALKCYKP